jgi:hypothetical protein
VWKQKLAVDGVCLLSCVKGDDWQTGLRRDLYLIRPFRVLLTVSHTTLAGTQFT